ncbi:MAG: BamA/TamA family outer membrane protein [Balneolia bacterium]|nr:BamA/TamA family outer membrane protein [Balneolia bacterium]
MRICLLLFLGFCLLTLNGLSSEASYASSSAEMPGDDAVTFAAFDEIRRTQVRKVKVEGNETFSDMVLKDNIATEAPGFFRRVQFWRRGGYDFSETEVRRDVIRIERFYRRRGFYDINVTHQIEEGKREHQRIVTFIVQEGEPTIVDNLELIFENTDEDFAEEIKEFRDFQRARSSNPLSEGRRYEVVRHPDIEANYLNALRNSGFAFARTRIEAEVDTVARLADVRVIMEPKQIATFRNIEVEGDLTVSESLIRYQSGIREGQQYSLRRMRDGQQLLFRHPLVRLATLSIPEQEPGEFVDIRIRIREQSLRSVQVLAGFGNEELLRGQVSWTHRNPFGNGHRFSVTTRASFIEQRANLEYLVPGFVNPRSNLSISPFGVRRIEENFELYRAGINNNLTYYHSQYLIGSVSYEFSRNDETARDGRSSISDSTQVYNVSALRLGALYNESTSERGQGWSVRPFAEFSGFAGTGSINYQRFSLDVRRFIDFSSTTKLALRVDSGLLLSGDPFSTPANIRFYSGGTNSVRGYSRRQLGPKRAVTDEDGNFQQYVPIGGQSMLMFNSEIRQDLPFLLNGLQIAGFLDGGQVWVNYTDTNPADFKYGAGGGVRYMSPIGPIRLDIGWKLNPGEEDLNSFEGQSFGGVNRWAIHFSIGQAF